MEKKSVIITDPDKEYAKLLCWKLIEKYENKIDFQIITDRKYFENIFSVQQKVDVLLVDSSFYNEMLLQHRINQIIVLTDEIGKTDDSEIIYLNRFMNMKKIVNEVSQYLCFEETEERRTKIISVVSGIGGSGKTSIAYGLAWHLCKLHRKVLFLSGEKSQSYRLFLKDKTPLTFETGKALAVPNADIYHILNKTVRQEEFYYIPPSEKSLELFGLTSDIYLQFLKEAKESYDYEYIIVDWDTGSGISIKKLVEDSNNVIHVILQGEMANIKLSYFTNNIDCSDYEKFITVCNRSNEENNRFVSGQSIEMISAFLEEGELESKESIQHCSKLENLTWAVIG